MPVMQVCRPLPPPCLLASHVCRVCDCLLPHSMAYTLPGPPSPAAVTAITAALELVLLLTIWLAGRGRGKARAAALPGALPAAKDPRLWLGLPAAVLAGLEVGCGLAAASCSGLDLCQHRLAGCCRLCLCCCVLPPGCRQDGSLDC
jgi:hypothetical protein